MRIEAASVFPTVLHVSHYRFGRRHDPACWPVMVGLARQFRTVVVSGSDPGYFSQNDPDGDQRAAEAGGLIQSKPCTWQ
jgi:hypothetical protein